MSTKRPPRVQPGWLLFALVALEFADDTDYAFIVRAGFGFISGVFVVLFAASIQNAIAHRKDRQ